MALLALPLPLLLLLLSHIGLAIASSQCRLVAHSQAVLAAPSPSATFIGSSSSTASGTASASASSATPSEKPFAYGKDVIRGVNLGGWLVLEPWITPSIFENTNNTDVVDEYTMGQLLGSDAALSLLQPHWETWITEDDFAAIAAAGLNHVRIPLGYWSVPITSASTNHSTSISPYTAGAWTYLLRGLTWAKQHGVHVIVDLHGAPGSQNGYDNSGQRTSSPAWADSDTDNVARTLDLIRFIVNNVGGMVDVIELLNEGGGFEGSDWAAAIRGYFSDGYTVVRDTAGGALQVMIGDAFLGVDSWENFLTYPSAQGVMMDYHEYQIFSGPELARSFDEHITFACSLIPNLASYATQNIYTVVGEWSTAATDCAKWLNGRGVGARWDGTWYPGSPNAPAAFGSCDGWTGSSANFSTAYKSFLRQYWEVQVEIGEQVQGWVFWAWKAENADEWSYQKGLAGGWIPQDPTNRMYPNICPSSSS